LPSKKKNQHLYLVWSLGSYRRMYLLGGMYLLPTRGYTARL